VRGSHTSEASPKLVSGAAALERFNVRENGLPFELSFREGYSIGLFLDQRDNRRRLLTGHVAANFPVSPGETAWTGATPGSAPSGSGGGTPLQHPSLLNTFAYTCGFSVCAARAGMRVTSLDLSKKYLEWGKRNFALNGLDPGHHDFIFGDVFDWLKRFAKKQRSFDVIVLDPPTFSQSRESGVFRAEKDYAKLIGKALAVLAPRGLLLASSNAANWSADAFMGCLEQAVRTTGRSILQKHYVPQPPDFPISRAEPAYLKTTWFRIA